MPVSTLIILCYILDGIKVSVTLESVLLVCGLKIIMQEKNSDLDSYRLV